MLAKIIVEVLRTNLKKEELLREISKNPAKYELTYTVWQLINAAKGNVAVLTEDLEDFNTEEKTEPLAAEFPNIDIKMGAF